MTEIQTNLYNLSKHSDTFLSHCKNNKPPMKLSDTVSRIFRRFANPMTVKKDNVLIAQIAMLVCDTLLSLFIIIYNACPQASIHPQEPKRIRSLG